MTEISLQTAGSTLLLVVTSLLAIGLSYFVYRHTVPPVSTGWRTLLITLRSLAVMAILLLLFEPILSITRKKQEKPVVAVLIDTSASMALVDQKVDRPAVLREILQAELFASDRRDYELAFFPFSHALADRLQQRPDSLALDDDGTDIKQALADLREKLAEEYFAAVVLITDGADNLGESPARFAASYGVPIYPIGVGDPSEQKDVLITNYVTNEIAYAGSRVPVDVYVKSSGFQSSRVVVHLVHAGKTLDMQMVTLSGRGLEQKVRLHFTPESEGLAKYEIRLPQLEGELTTINNTKPFYTKVLKSRLKILIIAGGPSADFLFLKRTLKADANIEVETFVEKHKGQFYKTPSLPPPTALDKVDCVVLLDYPRRSSNLQELQKLRGVLAKGKPVLLLTGRNVDYEKLWNLKEFLPLETEPSKREEQSIYLNVLPPGVHHPLLRISEEELEIKESWQELPPIFTNLRSSKVRSTAQVLASIDVDRSQAVRRSTLPLITAYNSGKRKSVAVLAYGLWRWDLMMRGVGKSDETYRRFVRNTVRWLTTQEDSKLVRITSNKEIYRSGEEVEFTAQVYFEDYQPVDGAEVVVQLAGGKEAHELTLRNIGDGRYQGGFQVLEGGDYQFNGTAHQQGRVLGRDSGKFSVEAFSLEYQDTRMNEELLRRMARESGGTFYTPSDFGNVTNKLDFPQKYVTLKSEWEIWNRTPMLVLCILLVGTEWFVRKRKGML
ncbi:MAG: hypothetical protein ACE5IY_09845 [bacterium]